jgi:ApbE superfamily uncharacterized protein (UPF0280 family)
MRRAMALAALALTVLALAVSGGVATAQERVTRIDGSRLLATCTSSTVAMARGCEAYLSGIADASTLFSREVNGARPAGAICIPNELTGPQLRQRVVEWLNANPRDRRRPAGEIVLHILREAYPCR